MSRLFLILLLIAAPLLAQTPRSQPEPSPQPATRDNWVYQQGALRNRAHQILKSELSRRLDHACDPLKLSNAAFGNCFAADEAITERNYRAFVQALKASLAIEPPDVSSERLPLPSKNFAAGEAAWHTYVDKTCAALGDTVYGASGAATDITMCQQNLTRQHMKDLSEVFLDNIQL